MFDVVPALYYYLKYVLDTSSEGKFFSRMPNVHILCPYYVKNQKQKTHESNVALTDVWLYLQNLSSMNRL